VSIAPSSSLTFAATATVNDRDATIAYQWQMSTNSGATWTNIAGATTRTYTAVQGNQTYLLRVQAISTNPDGSGTSTFTAPDSVMGHSGSLMLNDFGNVLTGGNNNYSISGSTSSSTVVLGNGNNGAAISGNANTINLGGGNDSVYVSGNGNTVS